MKIAVITTVTIPATTANSIEVMKVCHALAQNGHDISLTVPGKEMPEWNSLANQYGLQQQFQVKTRSAWKVLKRYDFAWSTVRNAHQTGAELLYTWSPQAALVGLWYRMPTILEVHDLPTGKFGPFLLKNFFRIEGKKRLLCITQALAGKLENLLGEDYHPEMVQIAPNGTDLSQYQDLPDATTARQMLSLPEKITVGYTGHFYQGRGTELLLSLAKAFPDVSFLWVGGNPANVQEWREKLERESVQNIILTGFIANTLLPLYQAAAEILVMPYETSISGSGGGNSAEICSPMKMFDYLAAGRAILTSDLPVFHEVLNEKNAVFCPPEDAESWRKQLSLLLENPPLRESLSMQARHDAAQYTWQHRAEKALEGF
jgi:glycosyltransferase involved in cell wall biosynthesis